MKRILLWLSGGVLVLLLAAFLLVQGVLRASLADVDGEKRLAGLSAEVLVVRDDQGVPTLRGESAQDLAFATGFVHAQERFFQMDTLRRSGAGELSALFGEVALDFDRERRRWRGRAYAEASLANLPAEQRERIHAYTQGVNAGLDALGARPPEYWLLRARPEPWQAEDSLLAGLSMFFYLTDSEASRALRLDQMAETLPGPVLAFLLDPADSRDAPLLEEAMPLYPPLPDADVMTTRDFDDVIMDYRQLFGGVMPLPGSNNWAVDASLGRDGQAMLAGDMHLGISVPNTWYRLRLEETQEDGVTLTGVSLPGVPGVIAGSNEHVAWAFTNSYGDWSTRVRLRRDADDASYYLSPEGRVPLQRHEERIVVKDGDDELMEYEWTQWGPVVEAGDEQEHVLVWTGAMPGGLNLAFDDLYRARDLDAALLAGTRLGIPPQNMLVADRHGDIGWTIAGQIPDRGNWVQAGETLPTSDIFTAAHGWLSAEDWPQVQRPDHGRLWTANARVAGDENLSKVGDGGYPMAARQRQIRDRLFEADHFDERDMLNIQLDDEARMLYEWVPLALDTANDAPANPGRARFRHEIAHWHGHAWPDSTGYPLLRDFRQAVHARVLGPLLHPVIEAHPDFNMRPILKRERAVQMLLDARPAHLLAPAYAEWSDLLADAMDAVIADNGLDDAEQALPAWGERNRATIRHPFGDFHPLLARRLNMPDEALPGDAYLPRVQLGNFGASQRMVVSPGDEAAGLFHMPAGQSGHFLSPWYRAGHEDWAQGRPSPFLPGEPVHQLTLRPE